MKVAIVHEMLVKLGGAENVARDIWSLFPDADVHTLIYDEKKVGAVFPKEKVKCSGPAQRVYKLFGRQRLALPWMAKSVEQIDLSGYDLVIASSSGFAHGCVTRPDTPFIVYSHTPARYLWDYTHQYPKDIGWSKGLKRMILQGITHGLRVWDFQAGQRADVIIAASRQVASRVRKYYRRDAQVIYPPVETEKFFPGQLPLASRSTYVIASALTEFKRVDVAVKAFTALGAPWRLVVASDGDQAEYLKSVAGPNVEFVGRQTAEQLNGLYENARGFLMTNRDDFGIGPVEAMAAGVPVLGLGEGGLTETSADGLTGRFFHDPDGSDFTLALKSFDAEVASGAYDSHSIRQHALKFRRQRFLDEFASVVRGVVG